METKDNPVLKFIVKTERNLTVLILELLFLVKIVIIKKMFDWFMNTFIMY